MLLEPIEKQTLATVAMQRLKEYIRSGSLRPGDPLPSQHKLAAQLSVSRPVLREAMRGLESAGMIEIRPGSGCYVREPDRVLDSGVLVEVFSHKEAVELLEARMVVEVELAAFAAARITDDDQEKLEAILRRLKRAAGRGQATAHITSEFHQALAHAGHNAVLFRMAQLLARPRMAQGLRIESTLPDIAAGEYESHRQLFEAIRSGNPETARSAMRAHLQQAHGWEDQLAAILDGGRTPW